MRPSYAVIRSHYHHPGKITRPQLFAEIGYPKLGIHPSWENTCAVRLSLALVKAGVMLPGSMVVKAGRYKGRRIEQNVELLSGHLTTLYGKPEKYTNGSDASAYIGTRQGILAFFQLYGPATDGINHIDLVSPSEKVDKCAYACYWTASTFLFWPLP